MTIPTIISLIGASLSLALALYALVRNFRFFADRAFAAGMVALAVEQVVVLLAGQTSELAMLLQWEYYRLIAVALLPCPWLFFSLSFARDNYRDYISAWKWQALSVSLLPLLLVVFFGHDLFANAAFFGAGTEWILRLGWAGYAFQILFLVNAVLILINLERTLRASFGKGRWRIKFTLLGIGSLFAVRIYHISETLLFSAASVRLSLLNGMVLVLAQLLIIVSILRDRLHRTNIYVSQQVLQNSLTLIVVGSYLLLLGVLAKAAQYSESGRLLLDNALFIFLAALGSAVLFLSEDVRLRVSRFIHRHFDRPTYDYREIWTTFTARTASLVDIRGICQAVARTVSETFGVSGVSIWLAEDGSSRPSLTASTVLSGSDPVTLKEIEKQVTVLMITMRDEKTPLDLCRSQKESGTARPGLNARTPLAELPFEGTGATSLPATETIRYCAPLAVGGEFLGVMTLNDRSGSVPFSFEDFDLLKTICEQAAGILLNHRLLESLRRAKELEVFQTFSAFFVHDLKNIASTLSLTLENLPVHFENPEFRKDAMHLISKSVEKIGTMTSRMSLLRGRLELQCRECDLNELVRSTVTGLESAGNQAFTNNLGAIPKLSIDPDQIQKVLINLLLNAREASPERGEIIVATELKGNWVALSVSDHGCGMSEDFIRRELFQPFKSTKDRGLGIGLYHSKVIVEAHHGNIEVESRQGEGSTFRVLLPLVSTRQAP